MAAILRSASPALAAALAGGAALWSADLFALTLAGGAGGYNWTSWDSDLVLDGVTYAAASPWLTRSSWSVTNTMEVPSLTVYLRALDAPFAGGANIKTQIAGGLFDGASFLLSRAYMIAPGQTSALGAIALFGGVVGAIDVIGTTATLTVKGKNNDLDQNAPRNLYQVGCNHAFCDPGCTLSRAAPNASYVVGTSPTTTFLPWTGSPPAAAVQYVGATITMTSGAASGQSSVVSASTSAGLTLVAALTHTPSSGDTFSAAGFTQAYAVGVGPTSSFIPWSGSPPAGAALYQNGTITLTSGAAAGQTADVASANSSGLTLAYPLTVTPAPGDAFTAFQGCDKTFNSGSGQSCTDRNNTLNFRGFPFVPPPNSAY